MAYYFTSEELIKSVKRRANIPDSQAMITDEEILDFANEEMLLNLVPLVISKHEDYYTINQTIPTISNQYAYPIPYRALGNKIRELAYLDNDRFVPLHRVSIDQITDSYNQLNYASALRFYILNENVVIDSQTQNIQFSELCFFFDLRPNMLVLSEHVAVITAINSTTGEITVSSTPDDFSAGLKYDFVKLNSPHRVLNFDVVASNVDIANNIFTFDPTDLPSELQVGDHVCLANQTNLVNAPSELHVMLAQMVAARVLESIGDVDGLKLANDKLGKMEQNTGLLIDNRVTGSPIKCSSRNKFLQARRRRR